MKSDKTNNKKSDKKNDLFRILPRHTQTELAALEQSILARGLDTPVIMDDSENIIDGHARRDICQRHGIDWQKGVDVRAGLTNDDKKALAISINLVRRSTPPTQKQRKEYAEIFLLANSAQSDESIAAIVGLSRSSVQRFRTGLTQLGKLKPVLATVDKNGVAKQVSSDKRRAGQQTRLYLKSKNEYAKLAPAVKGLADRGELKAGLVRRPNRLTAQLRRSVALEAVAASKPVALPRNIELVHSDFRNLKIKHGTVDLIATDVVWSISAYQDWVDLAAMAKKWLKPSGVFASYIGSQFLPDFLDACRKHLHFAWLFKYDFGAATRNIARHVIETFRPIVVFTRSPTVNLHYVKDTFEGNGREKDYHDWQQPLSVTKELIQRLAPKHGRSFVVDPQMGTGTSAVACAELGHRYLGADIDAEQVKRARYRLATELQARAG